MARSSASGSDSPSERSIRTVSSPPGAAAYAAAELAQALDESKVFLLSQLDEETVEELGIAHVSNGQEIARLCSRRRSCIILANAQNVIPTAAGEEEG